MSYIIETKDVCKQYGTFQALNNVSIHIEKGSIYGLVGKNGAGKSTLFKAISGLTPLKSGSISTFGSTTQKELNHNRSKIGFMMGSSFFPYLNAEQNLEYQRKLKGIVDKNEISRVLKLVKLEGNKKNVSGYSMGMKQRLSIANALMGHPDIVMLDEPINGLDPEGIADFRHMIQSINHDYGTTFIISSHILGELGIMGTQFGFIDKGELIEELSKEELFEKTKRSLVIKVDDTSKACLLLEESFGVKDYKVTGEDEIILNEKYSEPDKIAELFIRNNLHLYKLQPHELTLEDYFFNLIGETQNG